MNSDKEPNRVLVEIVKGRSSLVDDPESPDYLGPRRARPDSSVSGDIQTVLNDHLAQGAEWPPIITEIYSGENANDGSSLGILIVSKLAEKS